MINYARILVADNDAVSRNLLLRILEIQGYEVSLASSASEAREKLDKDRFELILIDTKMPGERTFELLKAARERFPDMAAVVITAFGDVATAANAIEYGAAECVTRPFDSQQISLVVERAIKRRLAIKSARHVSGDIPILKNP